MNRAEKKTINGGASKIVEGSAIQLTQGGMRVCPHPVLLDQHAKMLGSEERGREVCVPEMAHEHGSVEESPEA